MTPLLSLMQFLVQFFSLCISNSELERLFFSFLKGTDGSKCLH